MSNKSMLRCHVCFHFSIILFRVLGVNYPPKWNKTLRATLLCGDKNTEQNGSDTNLFLDHCQPSLLLEQMTSGFRARFARRAKIRMEEK